MSNNLDDIQAAGSDTRPPMLDRTDYESWSQTNRLYCRGRKMDCKFFIPINQGPFELGTTRDALGTTPEGGVLLGPERPRTYEDLSDTEKKRYDADVRATNIVLQGLPKDIYKLINHNIEAKAIWDNVKMLLAGSELTKEDRESQLYDEFERFKMLPGENINEYYVRFHKLVNDMRNIRMTMPNIQLNSKFVNNMSPEWDSQATIQDGQVVVQNVQGRQNQNQRYFARGNGTAGNEGAQNRAGNANAILDEEELLFLVGEQGNTFDADVDNQTSPRPRSELWITSSRQRMVSNTQAGPSNDQSYREVTVSTSEEELELAEATRNNCIVKMNGSVCVRKAGKMISAEGAKRPMQPLPVLPPAMGFLKYNGPIMGP
ncbi:hypothetical protein Tco_1146104 [Tanacetum coccineum]